MSNPPSVASQPDAPASAQPLGSAGAEFLPSLNVRDALWLIVVCAFVVVLLVSVGVESVFLLVFPNEQSPQVLLVLFTAAAGFLGGLFAPSPFGAVHATTASSNAGANMAG